MLLNGPIIKQKIYYIQMTLQDEDIMENRIKQNYGRLQMIEYKVERNN